jgi:hypothetical protein
MTQDTRPKRDRAPRAFATGLLLIGLMAAAGLGLLFAGLGAPAHLFALIGLSDSQAPLVPFLIGLYGPPLGLLAVITLSLHALIFHSSRALIAAAAFALLVGSAIAVVPL